VARTYSTEAPGRTSKRSYRPIPNRNRNRNRNPDPDSSPNPNPSPSPSVAFVGIGQREAKLSMVASISSCEIVPD